MEPESVMPSSLRHKCSACFKQYKLKVHLIEHMKASYHSVHQPKCGVCKKHCKTFESVREHLTGPLAKSKCAEIFSALGCCLCLSIFGSIDALIVHKASCAFSRPSIPDLISSHNVEMHVESETRISTAKLVALDTEMVGAGSDGTLDVCARVCLVDENEEVIFHSYVKPILPVADYRYEITGITEDNLVDAIPLIEVRKKVEEILRNGEFTWRMQTDGGKACLLIGHDLEHDLDCLQMNYPVNLVRDTAKYRPLLKTNLVRQSLKYLTKTYLGYEIQTGIHNPYEDSVAAMRLYKRMRSHVHQTEGSPVQSFDDSIYYTKKRSPFDSYRLSELAKKSPDDLLGMSKPAYKCWCMDLLQENVGA